MVVVCAFANFPPDAQTVFVQVVAAYTDKQTAARDFYVGANLHRPTNMRAGLENMSGVRPRDTLFLGHSIQAR